MRQTKIVVTRYGGPEVITVAEQECPAPMPGEVRVKVLAAGVSFSQAPCERAHSHLGVPFLDEPPPYGAQIGHGPPDGHR